MAMTDHTERDASTRPMATRHGVGPAKMNGPSRLVAVRRAEAIDADQSPDSGIAVALASATVDRAPRSMGIAS